MRRLICLMMMLLMMATCAYALDLPESIAEWQCANEHVVPLLLDANGDSLGQIVYRDYVRESPKGLVNVILTEGRGAGNLYIPEHVRDSQGVMPSDSSYRLLTIAGCKSIMELHPYMPIALALRAGDNIVLTIESSSLTEQELISFAEEILCSDRAISSDKELSQKNQHFPN